MNVLLWSAIIFISTLVQVLFATVRLIVMVKNKKILTTLIGFLNPQ